jgi:hypothetical protein
VSGIANRLEERGSARACSGCGAARGGFWAMGAVAGEPCQCSGGGGGCGCGDESAPGCGCDSAPPQVWSMLPEVRPTDQQGRELPMRLGSFSRSWGWTERAPWSNRRSPQATGTSSAAKATPPGPHGPIDPHTGKPPKEEKQNSDVPDWFQDNLVFRPEPVGRDGPFTLEDDCPYYLESTAPSDRGRTHGVEEQQERLAIEAYLDALPSWQRQIVEDSVWATYDNQAGPLGARKLSYGEFAVLCGYYQSLTSPGPCSPTSTRWLQCGMPEASPSGSALDGASSDGAFFLSETWTACEARVVEAAWAVLLNNPDLVAWALCLAGAADVVPCIVAKLNGFVQPPMSLDKVDVSPCPGKMVSHIGENRISMCDSDEFQLVPLAAHLYCAGTSADVECGVVAVAASLLHELVHICSGMGKHLPHDCPIEYLAGSNFVWAAMRRFPAASTSTCCREYAVVGINDPRYLPGLPRDCSSVRVRP